MDVTQRFSNRVENYIRYRPSYPREIVRLLEQHYGLNNTSTVADIGSGPGQFTRLLLEQDVTVYGVEPNGPMREAGETLMAAFPTFTSVNGTAEATTLQDQSVDFITAAQAAHWFKPEPTCAEFRRILRPDGWLVLIWNERISDQTAFQREYEALHHTYGTDYKEVGHQQIGDPGVRFFITGQYTLHSFSNAQHLDWESFKGRLLSSSYSPDLGHPNYEPMLQELKRLFDVYQQDAKIAIDYETKVFVGKPRSYS